jgi:hypothetical protein
MLSAKQTEDIVAAYVITGKGTDAQTRRTEHHKASDARVTLDKWRTEGIQNLRVLLNHGSRDEAITEAELTKAAENETP